MVRLFALITVVLAWPLMALAEPADADAEQAHTELLLNIQRAAQELDYAGVYTYQQGVVLKSSRVVHRVDGTGERERIEMLDGTPHELIRHNDDVQSLYPDHQLVIHEQRWSRRFPGLLQNTDASRLLEHYKMVVEPEPERVAGRDCMVIVLVPQDPHRYGHILCIDAENHLLLKTQTVTARQDVVDQVAFVSLTMGEQAAEERIAPSWDTSDWQESDLSMTMVDLNEKGWRIPLPPGFDVMMQVSRSLRLNDRVNQLVLSDGLAAISVFIEPFDDKRHSVSAQGGIHKGPFNIFRRRIADWWLTVLGQVPGDTLRDLAERIEYIPLAQ